MDDEVIEQFIAACYEDVSYVCRIERAAHGLIARRKSREIAATVNTSDYPATPEGAHALSARGLSETQIAYAFKVKLGTVKTWLSTSTEVTDV